MKHGVRWRRLARSGMEELLDRLGASPVEVAATLRSFGVRQPPAESAENPLASFLAAVVSADPTISSIELTPEAVVLRPASRRRRALRLELPCPVRSYVAILAPGVPSKPSAPPRSRRAARFRTPR